MTQLHLCPSLNRERGHLLGCNLGNKLRDAARDLDAVLVELALPKQAGQHRAPQLQLRREVARRRAFMRAQTKVQVE